MSVDRNEVRGVACSTVATLIDWVGGEPNARTEDELHVLVNAYICAPQEASDDPGGQGAADAGDRVGALVVELAGLVVAALHQHGRGKEWLDQYELDRLG